MFRNCASRCKLFVYSFYERKLTKNMYKYTQIHKYTNNFFYQKVYIIIYTQDFCFKMCTEKKKLFYERKLTIISSNHLVKHCYNRASKFVSRTLMTSANVSLEKKIFHRVENVIKQLVHTSAVRSSRYEARGKFREHSRSQSCSRLRLEELLRIFRGEDSWWKLFDLVTIQVPLKRIYPYSNVYFELV